MEPFAGWNQSRSLSLSLSLSLLLCPKTLLTVRNLLLNLPFLSFKCPWNAWNLSSFLQMQPSSPNHHLQSMASDGSAKKVRKPYTITKPRESWTEEEHDKFLEALQLFDRDWKKIEDFVGSKTVIQIRSHAQKYFLKVQKNGIIAHVPPPRPKRKATLPYPQKDSKNGIPDFAKVYNFIGSIFDPSTKDHMQKLKEMTPINVETVLLLMRNLTLNLSSSDFKQFRKLVSSNEIDSKWVGGVKGVVAANPISDHLPCQTPATG